MPRLFIPTTVGIVLWATLAADSRACGQRRHGCYQPPIYSISNVSPIAGINLSQFQPVDMKTAVSRRGWQEVNGKEIVWLVRVDDDQPKDPSAMHVRFVNDDISIVAYFVDFEQLRLAKALPPGSVVVLQGVVNMPDARVRLRLDRCRIVLANAR